jgi:hypothetical protein
VQVGFGLGFYTFVLHGFMRDDPGEIQQAALIDGAGPSQIFWRIILPLTRPALAALGALAFTWIFNDLLWAITVLRTEDRDAGDPGAARPAGAVRVELERHRGRLGHRGRPDGRGVPAVPAALHRDRGRPAAVHRRGPGPGPARCSGAFDGAHEADADDAAAGVRRRRSPVCARCCATGSRPAPTWCCAGSS